jgi:hypothetical protein
MAGNLCSLSTVVYLLGFGAVSLLFPRNSSSAEIFPRGGVIKRGTKNFDGRFFFPLLASSTAWQQHKQG